MNEITISPLEQLSSSFTYIETIASGSFGTVVHAKNKKTAQEVAVKIINKTRFKIDSSKIKQEIMILKQLDHPNIVKFLDYIETTNTIFIIMEYISKTTLKTFLTNNKDSINEETASIIMKHLLHAIQYIHSKNICHRDIKPENIMFVNESDLSSLKLIDFGLSAQHKEYFLLPEFCGTLIYMSPEQINNKNYTQGVDIWSAGVILYQLLNKGEHPFYQENDSKSKYISKIKQSKFKHIRQCSQMALHLVKVMLEPSPHIRITAQHALKHPWITRRMFDDIPHNIYESLSQSTVHQKVQNIFILSLLMKHFSGSSMGVTSSNNGSSSNACVNEEYEMKIKQTNHEGKVYFQHKRISMFEVKDNNTNNTNTIMKDNCCCCYYESHTKISENIEQESTHMNSMTSNSLISSNVNKQKSNAVTKQQMYLFNTPKKNNSDKHIINNINNGNTHSSSLIKRSYSSIEVVKATAIANTNGMKLKSIRSKFFSPKRTMQHEDEYNFLHFQNSLRSNCSPIKNQKLLSHIKKKLNNEFTIRESTYKKEIKIPITIHKTLKKIPMLPITNRKENICPLILPKIKLKSAQHLINVKIPCFPNYKLYHYPYKIAINLAIF